MPILTIQRQFRELGRIRMGERGAKGQPVKLSCFRLTSPSQELIDAAAEIYGGDVRIWNDAPGGPQFDLLSESEVLDVVVPPGNVFSQWFEMWSAGGCTRRCDGITEVIGDQPCQCPADPEARKQLASKGQACRPTTRLSLILPRIPDVGIWRLETHGFYAAAELPGTVELCRIATERGTMLPAQLRLEARARKVAGQGTRRYVVPVLELPRLTTAQLTAGTPFPADTGSVPSLPAGTVEKGDTDAATGEGAAEDVAPDPPSHQTPERQGTAPPADPPIPPDAPPTPPAAPPTNGAVGRSDRATQAQVRHLMRLARERFGPRAEEAAKEMAGLESFADMTKEHASEVIDSLNRLRKDSPIEKAEAVLADAFGPLEDVTE